MSADIEQVQLKAKMPEDIQRILNLPIKASSFPNLTAQLKKPEGTMHLRPIQNEMLVRAAVNKGLLALVGVGEGKTLTTFLLPLVMGAKKPLLLIPASMRSQAVDDFYEYNKHFNLPTHLELRSYEEISTQPGLLNRIQPDLIIADEVHKIKNPNSTRTRRIKRYFQWCRKNNVPSPMFAGLSGSITSTSLMDFWHLSSWALKYNSPLPLKWAYVSAWAAAIDKSKTPDRKDIMSLAPIMRKFNTSDVREAFKRNLHNAKGVVISTKGFPSTQLVLESKSEKLSKTIELALARASETWQTPDGDELDCALSLVRLKRQLVCGFYYFWDWPNEPDTEWLEARKNWHKECREYIKTAPEGMDTPALLERALISTFNGEVQLRFPKSVFEAYLDWAKVKDRPLPPVGTRWICSSFLKNVQTWAEAQSEPPLIWYEHGAVAQGLQHLTGWTNYARGPIADAALVGVNKPHTALISIKAHSQGKNLQAWGNSIVAHPLSDAARWEQLLGRYHRQGQTRKQVSATIYNYSEFAAALLSARQGAEYITESTGLEQRLTRSVWV